MMAASSHVPAFTFLFNRPTAAPQPINYLRRINSEQHLHYQLEVLTQIRRCGNFIIEVPLPMTDCSNIANSAS